MGGVSGFAIYRDDARALTSVALGLGNATRVLWDRAGSNIAQSRAVNADRPRAGAARAFGIHDDHNILQS